MKTNYCLNYLTCGNLASEGSDYCKECKPKPPEKQVYIDQKTERIEKWEHHRKKQVAK